jgi:hypothetical protein
VQPVVLLHHQVKEMLAVLLLPVAHHLAAAVVAEQTQPVAVRRPRWQEMAEMVFHHHIQERQ